MESSSIEDLVKKIYQAISIYTNDISINDLKTILNQSIHAINIEEELRALKITFKDLINFLESKKMIGEIKNKFDMNCLTFKYTPSEKNWNLFSRLADTFEEINNPLDGDNNHIFHDSYNKFEILDNANDEIFKDKKSVFNSSIPVNILSKNKNKRVENLVTRKENVNVRVPKMYDDLIEKLEEVDVECQASKTIQNYNKFVMESLLMNKKVKNSTKLSFELSSNNSSPKYIQKDFQSKSEYKSSFTKDYHFDKFNSTDNNSTLKEKPVVQSYHSIDDTITSRSNHKSINKNVNFKWTILDEGSIESNILESDDSIQKQSLLEISSIVINSNDGVKNHHSTSTNKKLTSSSKKHYKQMNVENFDTLEKSNIFSKLYMHSWFDDPKNVKGTSGINDGDKVRHSLYKDKNNHSIDSVVTEKLPLTREDKENSESLKKILFNERHFTIWKETIMNEEM